MVKFRIFILELWDFIHQIVRDFKAINTWVFPYWPGADPGFQVRGGALKKIAPSRGRREHLRGISCEKSLM
jgi:hypothetical protein